MPTQGSPETHKGTRRPSDAHPASAAVPSRNVPSPRPHLPPSRDLPAGSSASPPPPSAPCRHARGNVLSPYALRSPAPRRPVADPRLPPTAQGLHRRPDIELRVPSHCLSPYLGKQGIQDGFYRPIMRPDDSAAPGDTRFRRAGHHKAPAEHSSIVKYVI